MKYPGAPYHASNRDAHREAILQHAKDRKAIFKTYWTFLKTAANASAKTDRKPHPF